MYVPLWKVPTDMKPLIFLDLDDVLVLSHSFTSRQAIMNFKSVDIDAWPGLWEELIFAEAKNNLSTLHNEFLPEYIISSSWSNYLTKEQLKMIFRRMGIGYVAENLHIQWKTTKGLQSSRLDEIEQWISEHRVANQKMLILDDYESGWSLKKSSLYKKGFVVLCDVYVGLVAEKLAEAQNRLRKQEVNKTNYSNVQEKD